MINRNTLSNQILCEVIDTIKKGRYEKGSLIPTEKEFAQSLNVSRNSVREAVKALNLAGITKSIPGKGTVLNVNPEDLNGDIKILLRHISGVSFIDIIHARKALECEAAALAAGRVKDDPQGVMRLKKADDALITALETTNKFDMSKEGKDFHMAVAELSGNPLLCELLRSLIGDFRGSLSYLGLGTLDHQDEIKLHHDIYEAIMAGDPVAARQAEDRHFCNSIDQYNLQIKKGE